MEQLKPINLKQSYIKLVGNAAQVISNYLKPLLKNEDTVSVTQSFSKELLTLPPFGEDEEDISYDVDLYLLTLHLKKQ